MRNNIVAIKKKKIHNILFKSKENCRGSNYIIYIEDYLFKIILQVSKQSFDIFLKGLL